jgi:hypothetical protein
VVNVCISQCSEGSRKHLIRGTNIAHLSCNMSTACLTTKRKDCTFEYELGWFFASDKVWVKSKSKLVIARGWTVKCLMHNAYLCVVWSCF